MFSIVYPKPPLLVVRIGGASNKRKMWCSEVSIHFFLPFSSWEAAFLLVSTKNCNLWAWAQYLFCILSQSDKFVKFDGKSVNRWLPVLDQPRGHDSLCWSKGVLPLGTRMFFVCCTWGFCTNEKQLTLGLKQQWKQWEMACSGQDKKHPSSSSIYNSHEAERKIKKGRNHKS